ncbi:N-6 DNA Methylase [uncultured archaeon]|nr:N-6 DNA Methylase [uncultured archaeon]
MAEESSIDLQKWANAQETEIELDIQGKIIDFLNPEISRPDKPEERIRQLLARSLFYEYGYPKELMAFEVSIKDGSKEIKDVVNGNPTRADIVIYKTKEAKQSYDQGNIFAIFETKKQDRQDGYNQLVSYIERTSSEGGGWSNGRQLDFYRRIIKSPSEQEFKKWPGFPKYKQAWDAVGKYKKDELIIPHNLKPIFLTAHNAIYKSGINSEDVALDMVRIILAKQRDELEPGNDSQFYCTPDEFSNNIGQKTVADRVRNLFKKVRDENLDVFDEHEKITATDEEISTIASYLSIYSLTKADTDVIGTAYEVYVASHLKGERGQYFTNRLLIKLIVNILNPNENDIVLDPACGSAGFLLTTLNYVKNKVNNSQRTIEAKIDTINKFRGNLFGIDISPKLVKVAQANMLLGKDGHTGIVKADSLNPIEEQLPAFFWKKAGFNKPSIIMTNPPFGSSTEHKIKNKKKLEQFEIGCIWDKNEKNTLVKLEKLAETSGRPPELLFLERCIQWVRPGGKIGIVMARGQLDGKEALPLRNLVLKQCKILAVVNAHDDSFQPFCGSKASLLMLQKWKDDEERNNDYKIFMGISKKIGQNSRGEPIFKRDLEGKVVIYNGAPVLDHDIDEIIQAYYNFKIGKPITHSFCYSIKRSEVDLNTLSFNPIHYLPKLNESIKIILALGDDESQWSIKRLGDIANVFNGPRFKRPYADDGVTSGEGIIPYYTGTAMTQTKGENIKYLDKKRANKAQLKQLEKLAIYKDWILITDSGTLGRIIYTLPFHDGVIATNNLIRVVIDDQVLRGYVYEFLQSPLGQNQMLKNTYGTNQEHLEPNHVADVLVPIPKDENILKIIGENALNSIKLMQESILLRSNARKELYNVLKI